MMPGMTNESAERLRDSMAGWNIVALRALLDEALAAERRATVERIRAGLGAGRTDQFGERVHPAVTLETLLDEEAR